MSGETPFNLKMNFGPDPEPGVNAVSRALALMDVFEVGESTLTLAELSRRCGMHKSTVLRLARTLAQSDYMVQTDNSQWRLGPAAGWLGARYQAGFDVNNVIDPVLYALAQETGESASFYVREGDVRSCVARVEGPQSVRHNVRIGERLPLNLGSPGRVILAFTGAEGALYDAVRKCGHHISIGEREADVSSVAAPVFGLRWRLIGSMCISGPSSRLTQSVLEGLAQRVIKAANHVSYAMTGVRTTSTPTVFARWHP